MCTYKTILPSRNHYRRGHYDFFSLLFQARNHATIDRILHDLRISHILQVDLGDTDLLMPQQSGQCVDIHAVLQLRLCIEVPECVGRYARILYSLPRNLYQPFNSTVGQLFSFHAQEEIIVW